MAKSNSLEGRFTVVNDEGKEVECEVLFTFDSDETNKHYVVYTDNTLDEEGNTKVFASTYSIEDDNSKLEPIETEKEWKIIEIILEEIQSHVGENIKGINDDKSEIREEVEIEEEKKLDAWIADMKCKINASGNNSIVDLFKYAEEITTLILDSNIICNEDIFMLVNEIDKSLPGTKTSLGMKAYSKGKYDVAERMFIDTNSKNNLAYIIRRGEVADPKKYTSKYVAELLKDGVHDKEPFSMINMALLWAINVGGIEGWKLADNIMSILPKEEISAAVEWWSDVTKTEDIEGYLVLYWLLKWNKIAKTDLGTKEEMRSKIFDNLKDVPDFV